MISSTQFAGSHHSFWTDCFPALEGYVRLVNAGAYDRTFDVLYWAVDPSRSALVSEVAYCLCRSPSLTDDDALAEAKIRLSNLPGVSVDDAPLSIVEVKAARKLSHRINVMIRGVVGSGFALSFDPVFIGCGLLGHARGDVRSTNVLIELKSVDRTFRTTDFRQLLTYVLQDRCRGGSTLTHIALVNGRRGISFIASIADLINDIAGSTLSNIESKFLAAVGAAGASR